MVATGVAPPKGWYTDPSAPGRERWWSGTEWTKHTWRAGWAERTLPQLPLPRWYRQGMRIGANTALRPVVVLQAFVVLLLFTSPMLWYLAGRGDAGLQAYLIATGVQVGTIAAAITLGVIGAVLSRRFGGLGAAFAGLAMSGFLLIMIGFSLSLMLPAIGALG